MPIFAEKKGRAATGRENSLQPHMVHKLRSSHQAASSTSSSNQNLACASPGQAMDTSARRPGRNRHQPGVSGDCGGRRCCARQRQCLLSARIDAWISGAGVSGQPWRTSRTARCLLLLARCWPPTWSAGLELCLGCLGARAALQQPRRQASSAKLPTGPLWEGGRSAALAPVALADNGTTRTVVVTEQGGQGPVWSFPSLGRDRESHRRPFLNQVRISFAILEVGRGEEYEWEWI